MQIKRLHIKNFKTFDDLDLELGDFNVFVGANASGKSNFLNILRFLRDIAQSGLENAVSLQGGVEYLRNVNIGAEVPTEFNVWFERNERTIILKVEGKWIQMRVKEQHSRFSFGYNSSKPRFSVIEDEAHVLADVYELKAENENDIEAELIREQLIREQRFSWSHHGDSVKVGPLDNVGERLQLLRKITGIAQEAEPFRDDLLLESETYGFFSKLVHQHLRTIRLYQLNADFAKSATPLTGKADLEEDASNIALVLKKILDDEEARKRLLDLVRYVLPYVQNVSIDRFLGSSLLIKFKEQYAEEALAASLISDGTLKMVAFIVALYFEDNAMIAFEEPESNLHPHLIARVVEMMKEQAGKKQIFVTTHSPEVVKHAGLEHLYLVSRDENGFSQITRPKESEEVQVFLANELGLGDLYVQNLLDF